MSFDTKCYELADYFVRADEICRAETVNELAQLIQDTIEDSDSDRDEWRHEAAAAQRLK
jgi:F0F1-type ATP synthase epsilon subunit